MRDLAVAVAALVALGTVIVLLVNYHNRKLRRFDRLVREAARRRLSARERLPVENLLDKAEVPRSLRPRAKRFVERFAEAVGAEPEFLRAEDTVGGLVAVKKDALEPAVRKAWDDAGMDRRAADGLYVFAEDAFTVLMKTFRRSEWKALWAHVPQAERPRRDAEWLVLLAERSVRELIGYLENKG